MADQVVCNMSKLNKIIDEDEDLGKNYKIGQSYFMLSSKIDEYIVDSWYRQVIKRDIEPLIRSYMTNKEKSYINDIIKKLVDE